MRKLLPGTAKAAPYVPGTAKAAPYVPGTAKAAPYVPGTAKAAPYVLLVAFAFTLDAQPSGGRAVHVTLHEGTSMAAALSPDGRTIAIDLLGTRRTLPGGGRAKAITDI